ncbi:MAG: hypothetical protein Q8N26_23130 [Myxococcales bacterium]|nr:hypothetical protein [Myxococcales bacterium]
MGARPVQSTPGNGPTMTPTLRRLLKPLEVNCASHPPFERTEEATR